MAIDLKSIQVLVQRVVDFSIAYLKKHPILSGILLFLFLLFIFVRSLFIFLLFSIPIFIFMIFAFKLIFHIHQENLRTAKGENYPHARKLTPSRGGRNLDKRGNVYAHGQSVRRRSSKKYQNHVHFQEDSYEKDAIFSTEDKDNNDLVDKTAFVEETPKEIREVEVGDGSGLMPYRYNGERPRLESESSDEREEGDEPEDGNKAVEWTEDDQKNLMDLGFSEMERNKRLESLIAKRKARKLLSLQVRRTLLNIGRGDPTGEKNSFSIQKIGNFPRSKSSEALISPTPGSAPSVLLPFHNPFDIPYDPHEEKPNLTGGFQEELIENHYSDAVFCRHESFSLGCVSQGPWELPESSNCPNFLIRTKTRDIPELSRFKEQSDKDVSSELNETKTCRESEGKQCVNSSNDLPTQQFGDSEKVIDLTDTNKVENDSRSDRDDIHETISSSSSDVNAPFSSAHKDEILRSISFSVRKNVPIAELDTNFCQNGFFYNENVSPYDYKGMYVHTPSMSIASDLQVEVSEVGSQMTNLSSDGGSPKDYSEGNSGNEEVWVTSPQLNCVEENEARSGEVREVSEQDIMEVGFSRINQENGDISEEKLALPAHENTQISAEESEPELPNESNLENLKEPPNSVDNFSTDENMNDQVECVHDDQGIIDFIQHMYGEGGCTQPENNKPNSAEALGVRESKPQYVAEGLKITGNNTQVTNVLAENNPMKESLSTSHRYKAEDKDPSITSVNDPVTTISLKKGEDEKVGTPKIRKQPIKRVRLRDTKPKLIPEGTVESPSSTRKKFYLMANLSFDDIYEDCQQFDQQIEADEKSGDSIADQTQDSTTPKLIPEESSSPFSQFTGEKDINASGSVIEQWSDNGADIDSKTSLKENEKTETTKGVEYIGELVRSEDIEIHSKPDKIIDNSETLLVEESNNESSGYGATDNPDIAVTPILNNDKKQLEISESNFTQPKDLNSNFVESSELELEKPPEAEKVTEKLNFTCDNDTIVTEIVSEVGPSETSSSTSLRNVTDDKDPSIFLQKPKPISVIPKMALEQGTVVSSPSSTRKKFYLMANMSFDDIQIPEESKVEIEEDHNSGLKDSDESLGDVLAQASENLADSVSQTPIVETENVRITKGVEEIRELERSENVEGLSMLDNTIDSSKSVEVSGSGHLAELKTNNGPEIRVATGKIE